MQNNKHINSKGGVLKMAVNDIVEIVSHSHDGLYGMKGKILDIRTDKTDTDIRIMTEDGQDIWIDADDVSPY